MTSRNKIADAVAEVYDWIDSQINACCDACGKCCDFESYGHRLFVTSPEIIHFTEKLRPDDIKPMPTGRCPYNVNGKCSVYDYRFMGCRIFSCKGDGDLQSKLTEQALAKLKSICKEFNIDYKYTDLKTAINDTA